MKYKFRWSHIEVQMTCPEIPTTPAITNCINPGEPSIRGT